MNFPCQTLLAASSPGSVSVIVCTSPPPLTVSFTLAAFAQAAVEIKLPKITRKAVATTALFSCVYGNALLACARNFLGSNNTPRARPSVPAREATVSRLSWRARVIRSLQQSQLDQHGLETDQEIADRMLTNYLICIVLDSSCENCGEHYVGWQENQKVVLERASTCRF